MRDSATEFEIGVGTWAPERGGIRFSGKSKLWKTRFLITAEALAHLAGKGGCPDAQECRAIFIEFRADIVGLGQCLSPKIAHGAKEYLITESIVAAFQGNKD